MVIGPLFHKPVTGQDFFFAVSYSKPALRLRKVLGLYLAFTKKVRMFTLEVLERNLDIFLT